MLASTTSRCLRASVLQGTELQFPRLGIGQGVPGMTDSTLIVIKDLLK